MLLSLPSVGHLLLSTLSTLSSTQESVFILRKTLLEKTKVSSAGSYQLRIMSGLGIEHVPSII